MEDDPLKPPLVNQTRHSLLLLAQTMTEAAPATRDDAPRTSPEIGELLKGNTTLLVWLVFLALGGGILALYYARISYLPDIEWSSSIVYLAVASFIGGGLGLLLALSVFLPGVIWSELLVFDRTLVEEEVFCYEKSSEPCIRTILLYLGVPFGIVLLISHIALRVDVMVHSDKTAVTVYLAIVYLAIAAVLLVRTFFVGRLILTRLLIYGAVFDGLEEDLSARRVIKYLVFVIRCLAWTRRTKNPAGFDDKYRRRIFKYSIWFTLSVFLSQISMLVVYRLSGKLSWPSFGILTVICTTGVFVSNIVVAVSYRHYPRQAIAASLVAAAVLLFVADQFSSLSEGIMAFYGFGNNQRLNLVINEEGTAIMETLDLPNNWSPTEPDKVYDAEILSRLGSEYYLRVGRSDGIAGRKFTLPKSAVKSFISPGTDKAIGEEHTVNLLVNQDGLAIIDKLGLPPEYRTPNREGLRDLEILSKAGNEYYLRIGHSDVNPGRTFTLPKSTVRSLISTEGR